MKVGFISLGCSKNLVDTEMCIGIFKKERFEIVNEVEEAEVIVINTCGFIESAKEEAINCILEMAEYKKTGKCKYLLVMGCLVQRYKSDLEKSIPEVDLFLSIDEYQNIWEKIIEVISKDSNFNLNNTHLTSSNGSIINKDIKSINTLDYMDRVISTGNKTAYLKIAEGCSNRCTYCAIPYIRGPYVSRDMESILEEAKLLAKNGIEELIIIAQDTTKYGIDIYGESKLAELLEKLSKIDELKWIRFLYAYPESITDELIEIVKKNDKICKYFDIPLQHFSDKVLKRMNRKSDSKSIERLLEKIREEIPEVVIRTTMIVGFPEEDDEDFFELYEFINRVKFEKLGAFKYSKEDGTPAAKMPEQVHPKTKQSRLNKIMNLQQKISKIKLEEKIGNIYEVLVDGLTEDGKYLVARSYMDIPDEDGVIFIKNDGKTKIGTFVKCKIIDVKEYDLIGDTVC